MKLRRFLILLTVTLTSLATLLPTGQAETPLIIGIAYDTGGPGDHSFDDAVAVGVTLAKKSFPIQVLATVTVGSEEDRESRLRFLVDKGANSVIAVGSGYAAAVKIVSQKYPSRQFVIVNDASVSALNVASLVFAEDQGGYLAGTAAALVSKKGKIGFIGTSGQSKAYESGYVLGARTAKKAIAIDIKYAPDSWGAVATSMITGGADVIFLTTSGSDSDVINSVVNANKKGAAVSLIVVEPDQYVTLAKGTKKYILASVMKRVDKAVLNFISESVAGRSVVDVLNSKLGVYGRSYGIQNGGIELSLWSPSVIKYRKVINQAAKVAGKLFK